MSYIMKAQMRALHHHQKIENTQSHSNCNGNSDVTNEKQQELVSSIQHNNTVNNLNNNFLNIILQNYKNNNNNNSNNSSTIQHTLNQDVIVRDD